jgi:FkbM family methyltransferase
MFEKQEMQDFLETQGIPFKDGKIELPTWCRRVKIDVGLSGNSPQSKLWLDKDKKLLVFGFEPLKENIEMIITQSSPWPIKLDSSMIGERIYIIQSALGSTKHGSTTKFYATENDTGCSSMYKPSSFKVKYETEVPLWSLSHFLDCFPFDNISRIDFLKTDCQGADLEVLKGAEKYLEKICIITSEPEETHYIGAKNSDVDLSNFLKKRDFTLVNVPTTTDPTFFNKKYIKEIQENKITCNQIR